MHDTLTFLHQERNDFLPDEDVIIPSRKDDHLSPKIDLEPIKKKQVQISFEFEDETPPKIKLEPAKKKQVKIVIEPKEEHVRSVAVNEVSDVIKRAENVVNDIREATNDIQYCQSLNNNANLTRQDSIIKAQQKSEEAFRFLENEATSPVGVKFEESVTFIQNEESESVKSSIPVAKPRQKLEGEKDIDFILAEIERPLSPVESELFSKIPVSGGKGKVKTIKKHSKDPLKEFVKLSQDVDWDGDGCTDPIVKTITTRITTVTTETGSEQGKIVGDGGWWKISSKVFKILNEITLERSKLWKSSQHLNGTKQRRTSL